MHYLINKRYIAEQLCENKDKPEMQCDGKCYLKKKLRTVEKYEKPSTSEQDAPQAPAPPQTKIEWFLALVEKETKLSLESFACLTSTEPWALQHSLYEEKLLPRKHCLGLIEPPEAIA